MRSLAILLFCALAVGASHAYAAADADEVFRRFGDNVFQVRIVNRASGSKSSIGSGFFVHPQGYLVSNYHVVSELVYHPNDYTAELVAPDGSTAPLHLLNVDVVHDLAVLRAQREVAAPLSIRDGDIAKGTRLFSLGNPHDLGLAIVEGTYNGNVVHSLYEKMHFTGAINPGMSGGPAIDSDGRVVGVNVSTAGNELSFLVPAKFAQALLDATLSQADAPRVSALLEATREQLVTNQAGIVDRVLAAPFTATALGPYEAPGEIDSYFNCWGDDDLDPKEPYDHVRYQCSTSDSIYVASGMNTGTISFAHGLVSSEELNRFQFFTLYETVFEADKRWLHGSEEHVGSFECETNRVVHGASEFKVAFCARAYKKLHGLYDVVLKAASLDHNDRGMYTHLVLTGVSYENGLKLARRYMEAIRDGAA